MKKLHGQVRICLSSMDCILWLGVSSLFAFMVGLRDCSSLERERVTHTIWKSPEVRASLFANYLLTNQVTS